MTREERYKFIAKEIHFADWFMYFHLSFSEKLHQALKEAEEIINDLSVAPNEDKGTDFISREDVKARYKERFMDSLVDEDRNIDFSEYAEIPCKRFNEFIDSIPCAVPEREKREWIPVLSVEEMPKECLWVTHKGADYAYVELIGWDSERNCRTEDGGFWCDSNRLKDVVAYMLYSEPEPYKAESE